MKTLIVLPTFLERENLISLVPEIFARVDGVDVLVVDDGSIDGTVDFLNSYSKINSRLHFILRKKKEGLGRAYLQAFDWAEAKGYDYVVQMDADYSHRITDLSLMLEAKVSADFVVGSRCVYGAQTMNWNSSRRLLSWLGNHYVRFFLGRRIGDWTGGFNVWSMRVLRALRREEISAQGFIFQAELKYRALKLNFSPIEVPIIFEERREGHSKMSFRIIAEGLAHVWRLGSNISQSSYH